MQQKTMTFWINCTANLHFLLVETKINLSNYQNSKLICDRRSQDRVIITPCLCVDMIVCTKYLYTIDLNKFLHVPLWLDVKSDPNTPIWQQPERAELMTISSHKGCLQVDYVLFFISSTLRMIFRHNCMSRCPSRPD